MSDGPFRFDFDAGVPVIKRDHPIVPERQGEIIIRTDEPDALEINQVIDQLNDAFFLGRTSADPKRFFHESLLQGDPNSVS